MSETSKWELAKELFMDYTKDMEFCKVVRPKTSLLNKIKCFFGIHAWEYYGAYNDEFNLDEITNKRMCIFCDRHEVEVDLNSSNWKKIK